MKVLLAALLLLASPLLPANQDLQDLVQLVDYVGVDYAGAVENGLIVSEEEYAEMRDFSQAIVETLLALPASATQAAQLQQARQLQTMIAGKQPAAEVAALSGQLRRQLIQDYGIIVTPRDEPDLRGARQLYADNCAACHGAEGFGDGPLARGMEPPPIDFHDAARAGQRSLYGLYSTITQGVGGTSMPGFAQLSSRERWSLAYYVGRIAIDPASARAGAARLEAEGDHPLRSLDQMTTLSLEEAQAQYGDAGAEILAHLRNEPTAAFQDRAPLEFAGAQLEESLAAYVRGESDTAYDLAVEAYLEGFELMEPGLDAVAPELRLQIEAAMTQLRNGYRNREQPALQQERTEQLHALLGQAQARLNGTSLSGTSAFASAFLILLREGMEALLVVAALAAFLIKTERRDGLPYLHIGWGAALALGVGTWFVASRYINIGGEQRELAEGIAAVTAAVMLFYIGFWLHSKTHALQWKRFIEGNVRKALGTGSLWALAGLSFIAVYREVFETILFYQALWLQLDDAGQPMAYSGLGTAVVLLVVLAFIILRYSTRLPLRQFFGITGMLMFVLAVVFAGKGVAALQEAGRLPVNPIEFPRVELLGIYPNLQSLGFQLALIILAAVLLLGRSRRMVPAPTR